jgi:2,3-dihydroxybenzoate-AMP ligase
MTNTVVDLTEHDEYRRSGEWQPTTIVDGVRAAVAGRDDQLAVATIEGALTHAELDERSNRFALGLLRTGLVPGDAVLFQVGNELESVVAWYGVLKAGMRPVSSIPNHRLHEMTAIAVASGATAHLFQADYRSYDLAELSTRLTGAVEGITVRIVTRGAAAGQNDGVWAMDDLIASAPADEAGRVVAQIQAGLDAEDVALFQLSGGTTGVPKVIPHTHATYTSAARRWARNLQWGPESVALHFLPIMHHAGLCTALLPSHLVGGTVVLARGVDADLIETLVARHRVTWLHFNLAAFEPLQALARERTCDFSSITHFSWTFVRPELSGQAEELLGAPAVGSFGMGEGVHLSARRDDPPEIRRFTVGSTIGEFDRVKVLRPDSEVEVPDGEVGELCCSGPSVITAYHRNPEVDASSFTNDGYLRTGDLGIVETIAGRRCCSIAGRLKDQISRGGEKFMAAELEALLMEHPALVDVAAVGLTDERLGERVGVAVVLVSGVEPIDPEALRGELVRYLDGRQVAKFKWPERLVVLDALPRTAINKVRKNELRDLMESRSEEAR